MFTTNMLEIGNALHYGKEKGYSAENLFVDRKDRKIIEKYIDDNPQKVCEMRRLADEYRNISIKSLRYSLYAQFDTTGERNGYQEEYFEHRKRLSLMGMCSYLFDEEEYFRETEDIIWAICEEYTWCLPAHLGGQSLRTQQESGSAVPKDGKIVSESYGHRHTVDLFACETVRELAEVLHITGDRIAPQVRDRAISEMIDRVFARYLTFNKMHHFEIDLSNWSAVCGGSIGVAALYLIDEEDLLAPMIQRVLSDLDVFVSSYGEDGIGREGVGYWDYGFSNLCYFSWLLRERTADRINLFEDAKVKQIAQFPSHAFLFQDYCVNFSDCSGQGSCTKAVFCCLKEVYPELPVPSCFAAAEHEGGNWHIPVTLRDVIWRKELDAEAFKERSEYFPDAGWLVSCVKYGETPISCVVKGGSNDEPHNHNDLGHLIVMIAGEQLLCDLGSGEYTKDYFGAKRYDYLVNSSRGHSVPIIDGRYQREGKKSIAKVLSVERTKDWDEISMEISSAYQLQYLHSLVRHVCIYKEEYSILLRDTYQFEGDSLQITERFVSAAEPVVKPDGEVWICGKEHSIKLSCNKLDRMPKVTKEEFRKPGNRTESAWLIDYPLRIEQGDGTFCFRISYLELH